MADVAVLLGRLARDPRVRRRHRLLVFALLGYLALPFDLVPDFIPVVGYLDDALAVLLVLGRLVRAAGDELVAEHWPGSAGSLRALLRSVVVGG